MISNPKKLISSLVIKYITFPLLANENFKLELMETFRFMQTRVFHIQGPKGKYRQTGKLQMQRVKKVVPRRMSATKFNSKSEGFSSEINKPSSVNQKKTLPVSKFKSEQDFQHIPPW